MKALIMSVLCFGIIGSNAFAADHNYQCIADSLQAINSDIYYNLSSTEIDSMLTIPEMFGHIDAINAAKRCDSKLITGEQYQCISDSLQAINSDIWYNLSKDEIDEMLNNDVSGHLTTQKAAVRCGVNVQE